MNTMSFDSIALARMHDVGRYSKVVREAIIRNGLHVLDEPEDRNPVAIDRNQIPSVISVCDSRQRKQDSDAHDCCYVQIINLNAMVYTNV